MGSDADASPTFVQRPMLMIRSIRVNENLHIVLWLLKDLCWLMEYHVAALIMVIPTLSMGLYIAWLSAKDRSLFMHSLAVIFWISANSTWMIGDFFFQERGHGIAAAFFITGLCILALHYFVLVPLDAGATRNNKEIQG